MQAVAVIMAVVEEADFPVAVPIITFPGMPVEEAPSMPELTRIIPVASIQEMDWLLSVSDMFLPH